MLGWLPGSPRLIRTKTPPRMSSTAESPSMGESISLYCELGDSEVVMNPVKKERHLGRAQQGPVPV